MRLIKSIGCLTPVASVIYGVLAVLLLGQFGGQVLNYLRSMGWEQVPGTIISSEIEDAWNTTGERYAGRVVYTYEIEGVTYEGNQLDLRDSPYVGTREAAERLLIPYLVGTSVMLYVDPSDPTRTVLDRSVPSAIWVFVGLGSVLMLLSLGSGAQHLANRRKQT
mgnify:CR=1 FL=1